MLFDVIICGAGPAGAACALGLQHSGLKVAWIDKSSFPRDKICGDAIPSTVQRVLGKIDFKLKEHFLNNFHDKFTINACKLISPDFSSFDLSFVNKGHSAKRLDFDNYLFLLAQEKNKNATAFTGSGIDKITTTNEHITATLKNGKDISAKIIIGCDGAHSIVAKQLAKSVMDINNHIGAVRAYYKNVSGLEHDMLEIHFLKNYMPGYFWIFPLKNNVCNVGFGMVSKYISKQKINLRKSLLEIISEVNPIQQRFKDATLQNEVTGFGLPCGGKRNKISGSRFLLCGDAASLINPATGEGIGNAMISGQLASEQIIKCFEENNFNASFNSAYDNAVYKKLLGDLRIQSLLQKIAGEREWLINFALCQVSKHEFIRQRVRKFF